MKALTVICCALINIAAARKYLMDDEHNVKSPAHVEAELPANCPDICVFKNLANTNKWCFHSNSPHLLTGWQFIQTSAVTDTGVKYYTIKSGFYAQFQYYLQSLFDMLYVYYNNTEFDLKKFNAAIYFYNTFTSQLQWCPAFGWKIDSIDLNIAIRHSLMQCFKTLIMDICNFNAPWIGSSSKWFESCTRSQFQPYEQVKVQFATQNFQKSLAD